MCTHGDMFSLAVPEPDKAKNPIIFAVCFPQCFVVGLDRRLPVCGLRRALQKTSSQILIAFFVLSGLEVEGMTT